MGGSLVILADGGTSVDAALLCAYENSTPSTQHSQHSQRGLDVS